MISDMLEEFGFEQQRFSINWLSSAEPERFVQAVTDMAATIKELQNPGSAGE